MKFNLLAVVLLITGLFSCKKNIEEVTPANAISGTYEAETYNDIRHPLINYPINGQTIKLQIDPVSKDTVRVQVNSTRNGFYSPGDAVSYPKVYVKEFICDRCQYYKNYSISLASPVNPGTGENTIWFDPNNRAYYTYIPPKYTLGGVQTVFVKTK